MSQHNTPGNDPNQSPYGQDPAGQETSSRITAMPGPRTHPIWTPLPRSCARLKSSA